MGRVGARTLPHEQKSLLRCACCSQVWGTCPAPLGLTTVAAGPSSLHPMAPSRVQTSPRQACFEPPAFSPQDSKSPYSFQSRTSLFFKFLFFFFLIYCLWINFALFLQTSPHDLLTEFSRIQNIYFLFQHLILKIKTYGIRVPISAMDLPRNYLKVQKL